jgi:DNA-binding SARP family transcriptional activator
VSIEFRILGPIEASRAGERLDLGGGKQRGVLAILLLNANEVVSSDRLIDELWGESAPGTAAKALQVHISQLRKVLEPERASGDPGRVLVTRSPGYTLSIGAEDLDLTRFDRLAQEGRAALAAGDPGLAASLLGEALALWRGQPLGDLAFEQFAQAEIARMEELRLAALEDRLEADLQRGRHAEVIGELEQLLAAEPMRERPWAQLMLALYRSGRQAEALEAYRRAREALVEKLGIEPGKDLQAMHEAVLRQDPELDLDLTRIPATAPKSAAERTAETETAHPAEAGQAFVGRDRELAALGIALDRALAGQGSTHMIGGEPGIGKSRLADELSRIARTRGARVLWGRCWEAGGAPAYWPWVQALRAVIADTDPAALRALAGSRVSEVAQLLPELRERIPELPEPSSPESEGARFRLFDAASEFIRRAAASQPIVLVLDDLHAADTPSLLMLRFIAGEIGEARVLVLGTYRDVEVGPDHPLNAALDDLGRQQAAHLIALQGLDETQVSRLIETSAAVAPSRRAVSAIHRGTGGNPLFVGELVRLLVSENRLEDAAGDGGVRVAIPRGVTEVIGRRLERVSENCRRTLGVASVLGRDFDLETLAEVTQRPAGELLDVLDEAIAQRIVLEAPGAPDRLRFSHVLIRDVLYDELGASRRRRLHTRAGEALETLHHHDVDPHLASLAHHFFEAGPTADPDKALEYAQRAGDRAAAQLAYEEAARQYELGIRVLRTSGTGDDPTRCELSLALADARLRAGAEEEAKEEFLRAAEIARRLGDADSVARAALGYGGLVVWPAARGDPHLIPLLDEALEALPGADSGLRARLMARLSCAVRDQPNRDRGLPLSEEAVAMARRLDDRRTLAYALGAHCVLITDPDSTQRLSEKAREAVRVAEGIGELERAFTGHLYHLCSLLVASDVQGAKSALAAMIRHGEDLRTPTYLWGWAEIDAALALFEGRFEAADELIERAYEAGRHAQRFNAETAYELQRFLLRRELGGLDTCEEKLRAVAIRWPEYHILRAALADLYGEMGRTEEARAIFDDLARDGFAQVYFDEEFLASMTLLADVCALLADSDRAATMYERLLPYADRNAFAMIEIALGCVARPVGVLARTLGRADDSVRHLERAIEINARMGARPWVAHAELELGRALSAEPAGGDPTRATELFRRALREYEAMGMEPWRRRAQRELAELETRTGS